MEYAIETKNLTKFYGKHRGIENVSLQVAKGEIFGFIGPNGAGKSTTIRTLLSLIHKTSGEAYIFGMDFEKDKVKILERTGYLPSEVFYYDNMRAIDLLKYSASFYNKECDERIKILAERLELDLSKKIEDMSLGNKKKVGIVQGLLHSPDLIILDEPTSGLDPLMQKTFFDMIKEENERGATVLFSSHILSEVQKMCDRVAIIKDGQIIGVSRIDELIGHTYKKVLVEIPSEKTSIYEKMNFLQNELMNSIMNTVCKENQITFLYNGDLNDLVRNISKIEIQNLDISEPSLEEIFMHYYV